MLFNIIAVLGFTLCMAILMAGVPKGRKTYIRVNRYNHPYPKYIKGN